MKWRIVNYKKRPLSNQTKAATCENLPERSSNGRKDEYSKCTRNSKLKIVNSKVGVLLVFRELKIVYLEVHGFHGFRVLSQSRALVLMRGLVKYDVAPIFVWGKYDVAPIFVWGKYDLAPVLVIGCGGHYLAGVHETRQSARDKLVGRLRPADASPAAKHSF
ncbi:hypothetical protein E3N88_35116 [Mikania micrantha]|uniref:Uncharacterized protein n=1 Tax=Mikania micrantha TaxID=192012 RepID=A0A5N6M100_9ASTR|nr:hypothetical protein E3N88_35116 [Mikania micrantha]